MKLSKIGFVRNMPVLTVAFTTLAGRQILMTRKSLISLYAAELMTLCSRQVDVNRVVGSLTKKHAAVLFQMPDDTATLHWERMINGSRRTLRPLSASSASTHSHRERGFPTIDERVEGLRH